MEEVYLCNEMSHWHRLLFMAPHCNVGRELSWLYFVWNGSIRIVVFVFLLSHSVRHHSKAVCCQSSSFLSSVLDTRPCPIQPNRVISNGFQPRLWHQTRDLISSCSLQFSRLSWMSHTIRLPLILLSFPSHLILCFLYPVYIHFHPSFLDSDITLIFFLLCVIL